MGVCFFLLYSSLSFLGGATRVFLPFYLLPSPNREIDSVLEVAVDHSLPRVQQNDIYLILLSFSAAHRNLKISSENNQNWLVFTVLPLVEAPSVAAEMSDSV